MSPESEQRASARVPDRHAVIRIIAGALAGLAAATVVYFVMALYVWTVIHSGWTDEAIRTYYTSLYIVPLIVGLLAAWGAWAVVSRRARQPGPPIDPGGKPA